MIVIGSLSFVQVASAADVHTGDIVVHPEQGIGEVVSHSVVRDEVTVLMFDSEEDECRTFQAHSLGFVRCVNPTR